MINNKANLIDEIAGHEKVYFYGAGAVCAATLHFLRENYKCGNIQAIIVSAGHKMAEALEGIEIHQVDESGLDRDVPVIMATRENLYSEIRQSLEENGFRNLMRMDDSFAETLLRENAVIDKTLAYVRDGLLKFVPRPCMEYLVLNILDHCNLRCKGCDHFACIAEPYFVPYETICRDLERMAELMGTDGLLRMAVMGGEPLLHPDLLRILKAVRRFFPQTVIRLTTNGLLLLQQKDEFWKVCRENDVTIVNTKYPIRLDHEKMKEKAASERVKFMHFEGSENGRVSNKKIIDLSGENNPVKSFAGCHISNYGNFLMEGKLYGCPFSCQSYRVFNTKFHQNLRMTDSDYLDIYKIHSMREIMDFAARPKAYCRYCRGVKNGHKWERTKGDIHEWVE